jgi:hypothetical protein
MDYFFSKSSGMNIMFREVVVVVWKDLNPSGHPDKLPTGGVCFLNHHPEGRDFLPRLPAFCI